MGRTVVEGDATFLNGLDTGFRGRDLVDDPLRGGLAQAATRMCGAGDDAALTPPGVS